MSKKNFLKNKRGSYSLEAAICMPLILIFLTVLLTLNIRIFGACDSYSKNEDNFEANCDTVTVHRQVSAVFDSAGNIYSILFD